MPPRPTRRSRAGGRSGRCTACRSRTRISWTPPASAPRAARRSTATTCRRRDALIVTRIRAAGAITFGKTNTPEFGAGSQPSTRSSARRGIPYDLTKTCGGSSGGAAVALRLRHGADRRRQRHRRLAPQSARRSATSSASGRRRAVSPDESASWSPLSVSGPMARTVADVALFLSVLAGPNAAQPARDRRGPGAASAGRSAATSRACASRGGRGLGGIPFEPEIRRVVDAQPEGVRGPGLRGRGGGARLRRRGRGVSRRCGTCRTTRSYAALAQASGPSGSRTRSSGRSREAERQTGADVGRAPRRGRRACSPRAASSSSATSTSCCR